MFAHPKIEYKTMNIENTTDCNYLYSGSFDKLISFYCLHWTFNKIDALRSMYSMLKNEGEILIVMALGHPLLDVQKILDPELQEYGRVSIFVLHSITLLLYVIQFIYLDKYLDFKYLITLFS